MVFARRLFCVWLIWLPTLAAAGEVYLAGPQDYRQYLTRLGPGDTLRLAPGIYRQGLPLRNLSGEDGRSIVIEGPAEGPPVTFEARDHTITVSLIDVSHVTIRHLHLRGNGRRAHAVVAEGRGRFAHDVTLEHLDISGYDAAQAYVGISTKSPAWNWVIRNNRIARVGTGMYLGNSDGGAPFVAGLIEGNVVEETMGYNLQIKQQRPRSELDGMPRDGSVTVIRNNVFSKQAGGSQGPMARPNVLVGHWPLEGPGRNDRYLVHGNLFFQNPTERLFQGEGNVMVYNNLFLNLLGEAVAFLAHNDVPRDVHFLFNTVVSRGTAVRLTGAAAGHEQRVTGNAVFSEAPMQVAADALGDNAEHPLSALAETLVGPFDEIDGLDLRPRPGQLRAESNWEDISGLPGLERDFDGRPRTVPHYGAYVRPPGP